MVVVRFILLFEVTLSTKSDHVVLDGKFKVFALHAGQFRLEHDLVLVFVDVYAWTPRTAGDTLVVKPGHVAGKQTIYFILKRPQIAKRVVTNDAHNQPPECYYSVFELTALMP